MSALSAEITINCGLSCLESEELRVRIQCTIPLLMFFMYVRVSIDFSRKLFQ